jgi:hypothetical protein
MAAVHELTDTSALPQGGVSITSIARSTLGPLGANLSSLAYMFLHYALLVACARCKPPPCITQELLREKFMAAPVCRSPLSLCKRPHPGLAPPMHAACDLLRAAGTFQGSLPEKLHLMI